jgi:hypothetical protein
MKSVYCVPAVLSIANVNSKAFSTPFQDFLYEYIHVKKEVSLPHPV